MLDALLVGPSGHGGEGVYVSGLKSDPPPGTTYDLSADFHSSADGAQCRRLTEVALNQIVHRLAVPDMGFRALRLDRRYDLVHVHAHPISLSGLNGIPLVMSEGSSSAVYLLHYLGWSPERLRKRYATSRRLYRLLRLHDRLLAMDRAQTVFVFSEWARNINIEWGADPAKMKVIPPGFTVPDISFARARDDFVFLFVGSDFERKGGFEVIEAFAQITADHPYAKLVLAGTDPAERNPDRLIHGWVSAGRREAALARLAELEALGRVERHPWISQEALRGEIYPKASAFLMPSHAEGFGFTNVEAMSFGLPVITSTVGPAHEIVTQDVNGMLVEPGRVDQLADAMARMMEPGRAAALGGSARDSFLGRFTRTLFHQRLADLYGQTLGT
jgi:glycosyltransferase involved in cell wall biosynthesis